MLKLCNKTVHMLVGLKIVQVYDLVMFRCLFPFKNSAVTKIRVTINTKISLIC